MAPQPGWSAALLVPCDEYIMNFGAEKWLCVGIVHLAHQHSLLVQSGKCFMIFAKLCNSVKKGDEKWIPLLQATFQRSWFTFLSTLESIPWLFSSWGQDETVDTMCIAASLFIRASVWGPLGRAFQKKNALETIDFQHWVNTPCCDFFLQLEISIFEVAIVFQPYWKGGWSFPFFSQKKNHLLNLQVLDFFMSSIFLHSLASIIFQAQIRRYIDTLNSLLSLKTIVSIYLSSSIYLNKSTHQIRFTIKKMQAFVFPPFSQVGIFKTPGNFDEWLLGGAS